MNKISMASSSESGSQYPYPSTLNPASFVSIKLSGAHDYPLWETQMMCLVESQELVGFIDGTILTPPETTEHGEAAAADSTVEVVANEEYRLWKRSDRLVKSWILGSLQEIVLATVLGLTSARSVWTKLHSTFGLNPQVLASSSSASSYPYPSTVNPASIVSIKLLTHNYSLWETQMLCLLESEDLVGFIDGAIPKPPETITGPYLDDNAESSSNGNSTGEASSMVNEDYMMWKRSDRLVKGLILGSLSEDVLAKVVGLRLSSAKDVWDKLRALYFQENKEEKIEEELPTQQGVEYPYPSMFNVANFVTVKLSKVNYKLWVLQILSLVDILELRDFLMNEPPSQDNLLWRRTDMLLRGWILGSISEDDLMIVIDPDPFSTSRSIMIKIENIFVQDINKHVLSPKPVTTEIENIEEEREEEVPTQRGIRIKEYPYPSTFNVANVVTIKLSTKANYMFWFLQIRYLLDILDMLDFLMKEPPSEVVRQTNEDIHTWKLRNQDYLLWKRTDKLLQGWIIGSISEDVLTMGIFKTITMGIFKTIIPTSRSMMLIIEKIFVPDINKRILSPKPVTTEIENKEEEIEEEDFGVIEYSYLSTFNVANVVTIKLTEANYELWVAQIWSLVDILELRDFLEKEPPHQLGNQVWKRTDMLLRGWILATLSEDILKIVSDSDTFSTSRSVMIKIIETLVQDINEHIISPKPVTTEIEKSIRKYIPLYEATQAGNWEAAKRILDGDKEAATAIISANKYSVLHVAVVTGKHIDFVENLVQYLPTDALTTLRDKYNSTALDIAANVGNTKAAKILMNKNPALLSVTDNDGDRPLHTALNNKHRDTYLYLQSVSSDGHYAGESASRLLDSMILSENFDLALDLVKRYPHAAELKSLNIMSPLDAMLEMASCFQSGMRLNLLENFIYNCVPVKFENYNDRHHKLHCLGGNGDEENPANNRQTLLHHRVHFLGVCNRLNSMLWDVIQLLVPSIKNIRQRKLLHHQAAQLVKCLCEALKSLNDEDSFHDLSSKPLTKAARIGNLEVVEEILRIFPHTMWCEDESRHTIIEIAVINRSEKVFNKICHISELQEYFKSRVHDDGNTILHLAGRMAPLHKLNLVSGAALQMQRELQWFKEVEKLSNPLAKIFKNSSKETPEMVFTREHKDLVIAGEKWMKDTANSCSIAAALIITMVFAAAITVPGGNKEYNGLPVFYNDPGFLIFAVSDTISLFMSTTSLLMFLSILTARYAEQDFLHALPKRLVFGLLTLFLSITSMVIAFSSVVYLVFGGRKGWVITPLVALSFLPITSFVRLQFPLLIDVYSSTYGRGIFWQTK